MLSQTVRYALRTLGYLAGNRGARVRGETIAAATGIPANYLSKILNQLRKRGVVDSEKGWGGGFELREVSLDLRVRDIVTIFDGTDRIEEGGCVFGLPECDAARPCPLHAYWERIGATWTAMLEETKVRDLGLVKR